METSDKEKIALCALNSRFGYSPKTGLALMEELGSASAVFESPKGKLRKIAGPESRIPDLIDGELLSDAEAQVYRLLKRGFQLIGIRDKGYPGILKECGDPPLMLYLRSRDSPETIFSRPAISIVGTRDMSSYGKEWCERLVGALAGTKEKPLIVSGLAMGIDITAHRAALDFGLPTVAVMATGIDTVYPFRHIADADRIASTPGCGLISDYPPGTEALRFNFLRRNRIIAGLSSATLLVESKPKGGGMMTARLAHSYCRDVYALPGRVEDTRSQGCNILLREKIAEPVTDADSFVEALGFTPENTGSQPNAAEALDRGIPPAISAVLESMLKEEDMEKAIEILRMIASEREIGIGHISVETGIGYGRTASIVGILESAGLIITDILQRCSIAPSVKGGCSR